MGKGIGNRQLAIGNRQSGSSKGEIMITRWLFLLLAFLLVTPVAAQQDANADREAVRQAVLDYVEGIYNVEPARIERSVSPKLAKLGFYRPPAETAYRPGSSMAFQQLVEIAKNYNKEGKLRKDAPKDIAIYDVMDQTATVKLTAEWGVDYMHLAKIDGKWMIVNVLWQSHPPKK
jgi:Putative lumazine-binding